MALSAAGSAAKPAAPATAPRFRPPAIPWLQPKALTPPPALGPGLDLQRCGQALERLCAEANVQAEVAFGSRARGEAQADSDLDLAVIQRQIQLTPAEKQLCWRRWRQALGPLGVGVDLIVAGAAEAARLSGSRGPVFGGVAREGKVLHVAG